MTKLLQDDVFDVAAEACRALSMVCQTHPECIPEVRQVLAAAVQRNPELRDEVVYVLRRI
jgi:hypothetical protein